MGRDSGVGCSAAIQFFNSSGGAVSECLASASWNSTAINHLAKLSGVIELIILNIGLDIGVNLAGSFSMMVLVTTVHDHAPDAFCGGL
jgi:hypothetical protein